MSSILFQRVIKFIFNFPISQNLGPFALIFRTINFTRIVLCFYNKDTAWIYNNMVYLRTFTFVNKNKVVDYILLIFNSFADYPTNFIFATLTTCRRLF